jgi:hypothetical protein
MAYDSEYGDTGKGVEPGWKPALMEGRCVKAGFPVGHHDKPETLVLSIDSLQLTMPEVAPEAEVNRALEELLREGIDMDWMTFTGDGGGGGGPMYKKLPAGMTKQEAYRRFIDALGYVHEGPWVFRWRSTLDPNALRRPGSFPRPLTSGSVTLVHVG